MLLDEFGYRFLNLRIIPGIMPDSLFITFRKWHSFYRHRTVNLLNQLL